MRIKRGKWSLMRRNKSKSEFSFCHVDFYSRKLKTRGTVFVGYCSNTPGRIKLPVYNWYVWPLSSLRKWMKAVRSCHRLAGRNKEHFLKFVINNAESSKTSAASDVDWVCRVCRLSLSESSVLRNMQVCTCISPRYNVYQPYYLKTSSWGKDREVIQVWHQLFLWKKNLPYLKINKK